MKKSFTFLCVFLISVSLLGQTVTKRPQHFKIPGESQRNKAIEKLLHRKPDGRLFAGTNINRKTDALKSTQANKQKLDSVIYKNDTVNEEKDAFSYDANGNNTQEIDYDWVDSTSQWGDLWKSEYAYDANGNLTREIDYVPGDSTSQWVNDEKYEYSYDANGNNTQEIDYDWGNSTSQWGNDEKYEYSYDANGNNTQEIDYYWVDSTNQWVNRRKYEYAYNANGNCTQDIYYAWVDSTNHWVNYWKAEYAYDANGNRTQDIFYNWVDSTSQWVNSEKFEYTYNNSYSFTELLLPVFVDKNYVVHMLTDEIDYEWNKSTNEWINLDKGIYYYSNQNITGVSQHKSNLDVKVYPNPATDYLVVDLKNTSSPAQVELYNMVGQKVISQEIFDRQQISISNLKSGIYICKVTYKGKIQTIEIRKK